MLNHLRRYAATPLRLALLLLAACGSKAPSASEFRVGLVDRPNPYGDGHASARIAE